MRVIYPGNYVIVSAYSNVVDDGYTEFTFVYLRFQLDFSHCEVSVEESSCLSGSSIYAIFGTVRYEGRVRYAPGLGCKFYGLQ